MSHLKVAGAARRPIRRTRRSIAGKGEDERFGVIEFAVSADVTQGFRRAVVALPESAWHLHNNRPLVRLA